MANQAQEELLNALKRLYDTAEYSDLTISCGNKNYLVHKAVVCPRSEFFASACGEIASEATHERVVSLPDEDPTAVEKVVHYLYHLDYSTDLTVGQDYTNGYATGAHHQRDGHTEKDAHHEGASDDAMLEESSSAQGPDDSASIKLSSKDKKKNRKKQKKLSSGSISTVTTQPNGSPFKEADLSNGTRYTDYVVPVESPSPSSLVTHAKVYALSKRYNIHGLKLLALEKFRTEADQDWDTGDFLLAAKEVYTSTSAADQDIREAVTTIVYQHPEILDRDETQELIKGLDLGFDVLKRVRAKGGFL
ncbi:hypothetical protein DPV78_008324 [Talaromyces pinophilus]|nr:hypothetical protein DPV78_008324 [Talaromyces pinophilus]